VGYGSLKIHGEKFSQNEPVGWVAAGLRICGQAKDDGVHNPSSMVDCGKAVLFEGIL